MSCRPRRALGEQALRLVKEAGEKAREIERRALRRKVDEASRRPAPGSSDLLRRAFTVETTAGVDEGGRVRAVDTYDLVGMAPMHLKRPKRGN